MLLVHERRFDAIRQEAWPDILEAASTIWAMRLNALDDPI
jgi:hypothetical protein